MSIKSLHVAPYFIPLNSPLFDVATLKTYRVAPYFIPLGSPLLDVATLRTYRVAPLLYPVRLSPPLEGLGEVPLRPSPLTRSLSHLLLKELRELSL